MIAIVDIPITVKIEPNVCISDNYTNTVYDVDTFEITHELIDNGLFEVTVKHLGDHNDKLRDLKLTMNYDDLKELYTAPAATLTSIYNHYSCDIDDACAYDVEGHEKNIFLDWELDKVHSDMVAFISPNANSTEPYAPVMIVLFKNNENIEEHVKWWQDKMAADGYKNVHVVISDMTHDEYDKLTQCGDDDTNDTYYQQFTELCKVYEDTKKKKLDVKSDDIFDEFINELKKNPDFEVTEF